MKKNRLKYVKFILRCVGVIFFVGGCIDPSNKKNKEDGSSLANDTLSKSIDESRKGNYLKTKHKDYVVAAPCPSSGDDCTALTIGKKTFYITVDNIIGSPPKKISDRIWQEALNKHGIGFCLQHVDDSRWINNNELLLRVKINTDGKFSVMETSWADSKNTKLNLQFVECLRNNLNRLPQKEMKSSAALFQIMFRITKG
ncbi:MAG: hypothetical protein JXR76_04555 [Deltaproteobacteria bacterium]|nr:hypothetical protein [Deltaproteobacteria bacterium]